MGSARDYFGEGRSNSEAEVGQMEGDFQEITRIVCGILILAATGTERIPMQKLQSILGGMQPGNPLLSGIRFSIAGKVCHSTDVEKAIRVLSATGIVRLENDSDVVVENALLARTRLFFKTNPDYRSIRMASLLFYERLHDIPGPPQPIDIKCEKGDSAA
jgi:hypothetical protein